MLVASVLKKLLWVLRYPTFAPEQGPYQVGAIQTRIPGSVACQIHYPAAADASKKSTFCPYFRPKAVDGLASYSRTEPGLLDFLSNRNHPCLMNAEVATEKKFPIVMFSHGLGGCMEMYTQLCQQIASYGYMVVAMEHEDGSGAFAETAEGDYIPYKVPDDSPYSRDKVVNFRRPFLQQRVRETTAVLETILSASNDEKNQLDEQTLRILRAADTKKGVALVGHSFGGASMIMVAQQFLKSASSSASSIQPTSLCVVDPWAFSLEEDTLNQGVSNGSSGIPTLSVLSEAWLTNPETVKVDQFLQNSKGVVSLYAPNSVHASVADSVSWLPGFILRKLYLRGAKENKFDTILSVAKACVQQMQTGGINDTGNLQEYKFDEKKAKVLSSATSS